MHPGEAILGFLEGHVAEEHNLAGMVRAWGTKGRWPLSMGGKLSGLPLHSGHLYGHRLSLNYRFAEEPTINRQEKAEFTVRG